MDGNIVAPVIHLRLLSFIYLHIFPFSCISRYTSLRSRAIRRLVFFFNSVGNFIISSLSSKLEFFGVAQPPVNGHFSSLNWRYLPSIGLLFRPLGGKSTQNMLRNTVK